MFVELARLRESCVEGYQVYQTEFVVGTVFTCERELSNHHSNWTIIVKKPGYVQIASHVLDNLAQVLFPLLISPGASTVYDI